ncbi:MAG: multicopper oxidase family protein [Caldilineaceae bacterium]|nr:multicopper oxidase family protein [Caldilineaceae bacterium]
MTTSFNRHQLWIGVLVLLAAAVFFPTTALAQVAPPVTVELCATTGTVTMPDGASIAIWGYAPGNCTDNPAPQLPGPVLSFDEGATVQVILHNNLSAATALHFLGQEMVPDLTGTPAGGVQTYEFVATNPGTFLYEAGLLPNAQHQVAMGLYGALIVRPATAGQAYGTPATAYDDEAILVLSELDPALNNSAAPASFDMRNYAAKYRLINGKVYPNTDPISTAAGNRVLFRYINGGLEHHSMGVLGMAQTVLATDGNPLPNPYRVVAETVAPGQTVDAVAVVPATAPAGARFAVYAGGLRLNNNSAAGYGGMLTFLAVPEVGPGAGDDTTGPAVSNITFTPGVGEVVLNATVSDVGRGDSVITAAEYTIDDTAAPASPMAAVDGAFDSATENVTAAIPAATLAALTPGDHTVYVRGQDAAGNWGVYNLGVLSVDNVGPATSSLALNPNPSNGSADVQLSGTGNDTIAGNSNVVAAEYYIDLADPQNPPAPGVPMTLNMVAPIASLTATIPSSVVAGLSEGGHVVHVRSQDALGFWGPFAQIDLLVDRTGPETTNVTAAPNPNNGAQPVNPSQPAVRVDATVSEPGGGPVTSNVVQVEGFIDTVGADGSGFPFTPGDGLYDSPVEQAYAFIPLVNINQLSEGTHPIWVHGRDAAGNWGATVATDLVIDKTAPLVTNVNVTPNPTNSATTVQLIATASDSALPIDRAEWFVGGDPGAGNGTPMALAPNGPATDLAATIDVSAWATGDYTLSVRARDAAGNWSQAVSVILVVDDLIFADSFESGNTAQWSATTGPATVTAAAAMGNDGGALGMAVTLAQGDLAFVTDATPANETSYDARFYFHPNDARNRSGPLTIFAGRDAAGNVIFSVEYRRANNGNLQVRGTVLRQGGTTRTGWVTITNAPHAVEIVWQSSTAASFGLYVDGVQQQVRNNLNTSAFQLDEVRMGPSAGIVTGVQYYDAFVSKRSTATQFGP